jgi:hypothetical protein
MGLLQAMGCAKLVMVVLTDFSCSSNRDRDSAGSSTPTFNDKPTKVLVAAALSRRSCMAAMSLPNAATCEAWLPADSQALLIPTT